MMRSLAARTFHFFVYSNLFIAICAVLMTLQTYQLFIVDQSAAEYIPFVFFSTICSYSFHWYLTSESAIPSHRIQWIGSNKFVHVALFFLGIVGAGYYFIRLSEHWFWLGVGVFITFLYSAPKIPHPLFRALRKIAIGKTIFLAGVWTYVTTILPFFVNGDRLETDSILFIVSRFFLIYAICILFDYRDREDDRIRGIRSLITYMNDSGIRWLFLVSLIIFTAATVSLYFFTIPIFILVLLLIPGIITLALFSYAKRNFGDMLFYFLLDGLMALSSALTLLTGI